MSTDIAIFLPSLDGGGAEKVMLALASQFAARGHRCDLVIAISKGQLLHSVPEGVRLVELGQRKTINAALPLARYLGKEKPRTLLATVFSANIAALLASLLTFSRTRIVTCEASPTDWDVQAKTRLGTLLNKVAAKALYGRADATIAISEAVRDSALPYVGRSSTICVIPNPLPQASSPSNHPRRPCNKPLVLACGRLEPQKDYPTMLRAFALLRKEIDAKLVILGEGALHASLERQAAQLSISENVKFEGFVPNPCSYMQQATVFLHTARYEGFGVVLLEALACGCAVVATDSPGGVRDVLANGAFGALVPVGDERGLADAMSDVLMGRLKFRDPAQHLEQYRLDVIADRYLEVLLVGTGTIPSFG